MFSMGGYDIAMKISRRDARKLFLARQGLLQQNTFGRGATAVAKAVNQLGYLQIDTISVVNRAHEHVLQTRIPGASSHHLNKLMQARELFEYWSHAAAYLPMAHYRFSQPVMKGWSASREHDRKLARRVLDRIRAEGPLQSRDFEAPPGHKSGGWWDWKPTKQVLEYLYLSGELMVSHREGFQKVYDLKENILPDHVDTREPDHDEWSEHLVLSMLGALGVGSEYDVGYAKSTINRLCRVALGKPIRAALDRLVEAGDVVAVDVDGMSCYTTQACLDALPLRASKRRVQVLSPFDNLIINRRRTQALFDFDYQLECYVPEPKRKYGYFALPLLWGDELIGRMDAKADRQNGTLIIRNLVLEPGTMVDDALVTALNRGLASFTDANQCQHLQIERCSPRELKQQLSINLH